MTAAIHRHDQSSIEKLLFDFTCEWGEDWTRPLEIIAGLWFVCAVIYWMGLHSGGKSALYVMTKGRLLNKGKQRALRIRIRHSGPVSSEEQLKLDLFPPFANKVRRISLRGKLRQELRLFKTALLFSAVSVLNIGFHEFNFGTWIRMIQSRDFDLQSRGWLRTLSGIQSILGLALVALSLLSYFGQPFD